MIWDDWNSSSLGCIPVSPMIYIPEQLHGNWKYPWQEKEKRLPSTNQFVVFKIVSWHWGCIQKLKFDLLIIIHHAPLIWSVSIPSKVAGTFSLHLEKMVAKGWEVEGNGNFGGLRKLPISLIFLYTLYIYIHYTITHCLGDSFWCPCQHFRLIILQSRKERVHFFVVGVFGRRSSDPRNLSQSKKNQVISWLRNGWLDFKFSVSGRLRVLISDSDIRQLDLRVKTWLGTREMNKPNPNWNLWIPMDISLRFVKRSPEIWDWDWRLQTPTVRLLNVDKIGMFSLKGLRYSGFSEL